MADVEEVEESKTPREEAPQPDTQRPLSLGLPPGEDAKDLVVEKPGSFLPMIRKKKEPYVGLFGDYIDG